MSARIVEEMPHFALRVCYGVFRCSVCLCTCMRACVSFVYKCIAFDSTDRVCRTRIYFLPLFYIGMLLLLLTPLLRHFKQWEMNTKHTHQQTNQATTKRGWWLSTLTAHIRLWVSVCTSVLVFVLYAHDSHALLFTLRSRFALTHSRTFSSILK